MGFMWQKAGCRERKRIVLGVALVLVVVLSADLALAHVPVKVAAAGSVSGNRTEKETALAEPESEPEAGISDKEEEGIASTVETVVPILNYDVTNVVAPAKFAVALNPYRMEVRVDDMEISTDQVVSRKYGILNKSSTDKVVTVTLTVEDLNGGRIVFVDSAEEALKAEEDVYAVYLAALPADDSGIRIDGEAVNPDTSAADLADVEMTGTEDSAVVLREGENRLSFKLTGAVYSFEDGSGLTLDGEAAGQERSMRLSGLAPDGGSATAFTFVGAMNPNADWGKLVKGVRISAVYTYKTASGEETVIDGAGAMLRSE